jgi:hypothetical protein
MKKFIQVDPKQMVIDWVSSTAFTPVNKVAMRKLGHRAAILISETINQYKRWNVEGKLQDDMFFWTEESCEIETALNKSAQNREFKKLEEMSLLKRFTKKINNTKTCRFIKLNFDEIVTVLFEDVEKTKEEIKKKHAELRAKNKIHKDNFNLSRKLQNESSGKLQNESSGKLQNGTQLITKNHNKNKNINKNINKENLSIVEKIEDVELPTSVKNILKNQIDRLKSSYLPIIVLKFNAYKDSVNVDKFADVLNTVLSHEIKKDFSNYLDRSLNTYLENRTKYQNKSQQPIRTEKLPEGYDQSNVSPEGIDYNSMSVEELLEHRKFVQSLGQEPSADLEQILEERYPDFWKVKLREKHENKIDSSVDDMTPEERKKYYDEINAAKEQLAELKLKKKSKI